MVAMKTQKAAAVAKKTAQNIVQNIRPDILHQDSLFCLLAALPSAYPIT